MAGDLLLGIDIGTYSAKGVLCTPEGDVLASHVVQHTISMPRPDWVEHDADNIWWGGFVAICREILAQGYSGEDIAGVAVSAIGPCMLPVDSNGRPLRPGVLYGIDTRASAEIEWLNNHFGEEPMFELGGMSLTAQTVSPKILWLRRNEPEIYARTHKILTASSYLVHRLTGEYVIDKHTSTYLNPLVNLETMEYDARFAEPIVELEKLPRMLWSSEIAGTISAAAAAETGLRLGTPVTAGTVDAASESISVGVVEPGDMMIMYGTTMFFLLVTERPSPDPRMWTNGYVLPDSWDLAGGMSTTGALTRWFRDSFAGKELQEESAGGANAYARLAQEAESIPAGSGGVICLPYFAGERTPLNDPDARGVFAGLTISHTRAHMYHAMLEGTGFGVRHNLDVFSELGNTVNRMVAVGGGASNPLWLQIVSDITGQPQVVPERTIGASYGNAFLAGVAVGLVDGPEALAKDWVRIARIIEPQPKYAETYENYYRVYRSLFDHAKDDLHKLARLGRVSAPN